MFFFFQYNEGKDNFAIQAVPASHKRDYFKGLGVYM